MFAIIKTGGKQYFVHPGDKIRIEKLEIPEGKEVVFEHVLLMSDKKTEIGMPFLSNYTVRGKVLRQGKGKKIIVYKYKSKKRYHKKQGHRQLYTEVEILNITKGGEAESAAKTTAEKSKIGRIAKTSAKRPQKRTSAAGKKKVSVAAKKSTA